MNEASCHIPAADILESLAEAVFTVDSAWRITSFNKGAERVTGKRRQEVLGQLCHEVFRSSLCAQDCPLQKALAGGIAILVSRAFIATSEGRQVPVNVSAAVLRNGRHEVVGGIETFQDLRLPGAATCTMERAVQALQAQAIIAALRRNNNNRSAAAHELGMHKSTFFRKVKNLGIDLPPGDGRCRTSKQGNTP
ncbi:MAG: PAS domain-containing protein [Deltaproteobacteria bacterium]|jgi:PAS domain S-box-containing protein|nr:PAS domain-containing protein [Deltaproteobacteria bacterium]